MHSSAAREPGHTVARPLGRPAPIARPPGRPAASHGSAGSRFGTLVLTGCHVLSHTQESRILAAMLAAAEKRLGHLLGGSAATAALRSPAWGPHLHRWGSAFPDAPLLPEAHSLVPSARVAFCGDFVETEGEGGAARAGSVEGAALSGLRLAEQLQLVI